MGGRPGGGRGEGGGQWKGIGRAGIVAQQQQLGCHIVEEITLPFDCTHALVGGIRSTIFLPSVCMVHSVGMVGYRVG